MAKKGKFEKIGRNDAYFASHDEPEEKSSIFSKAKKAASDKLSKLDSQKVPEPQKEPSRFTYTKEKRKLIYEQKPDVEVAEAPKAPLIFMLSVVCLVLVINIVTTSRIADALSQQSLVIVKMLAAFAVYAVPSVIYMITRPSGNRLCNLRPVSASMVPIMTVSLGLVISLGLLQKYFITYTFSYNVPVGVTSQNVMIAILSSALVPAICEELFVRGVIQYEISRYAGGVSGMLAGAVVFALIHFDLQYISVYFTAGLVLGALTHITHSVLPSMIVHFLYNTILILFSDKLAYIALRHIGGTLFMIILGSFSFICLILLLRHVENISRKRALDAASHQKSSQNDDELYSKAQPSMKDSYYFISPDGQTMKKLGKILSSPMFIASVVIYAAVVIIKLNI